MKKMLLTGAPTSSEKKSRKNVAAAKH